MPDTVAERLIDAAEKLMRSGRKAKTLTTREIAAEAGTSVGLVNYHFGSKDVLVAKAAERVFADFMPRWSRVQEMANAAAEGAKQTGDGAAAAALRAGKEELKALLKDIAEATETTEDGSEFIIRRELTESDMTTVKFLAPVLRSFLPPGSDERELRWASFFIVAPLQLLFLRRDWFCDWTGTEVGNRAERDAVIDFLVDRVLEPFAGKPGKSSADIR